MTDVKRLQLHHNATSSSSSCCTASTDFPDPLTPSVSIIHRSQQVLLYQH